MFQSELRVTANTRSVYSGFFTHFLLSGREKKRAGLKRRCGQPAPPVSTLSPDALLHLDDLILKF